MTVMLLLLIVPGTLVGLAARMPLRVAVAAALPVTYGVVTIATFTYGVLGIGWGPATFALAVLVVSVALLVLTWPFLEGRALWAAFRRRRAEGPEQSGDARTPRRRRWRRPRLRSLLPNLRWAPLPAAGIAGGAWIIGQSNITELAGTTDGLDNVFQGWDAHWHVSYIRFIAETGLASPADAGLLRYPETGADLYYPSSWHALAALLVPLTGDDPNRVFNLFQIGTLSLAFPLGVAALAWIMLRRLNRPSVVAIAAAAAALSTPLFPSLPFAELRVAATPFAASIGLFGLAAALTIGALANRRLALPAVIALVGLTGVHPSALAAAAVTVIVWWLFDGLWRPVRGRLRDFLALALVGAVGGLMLLPQLLIISGDADAIAGFDFQMVGDRAHTWGQAAVLQVRHVTSFGVLWPLFVVAGIGVAYLLIRRSVWPVAMWGLTYVLIVNAMKVFDNDAGGWLRAAGSTFYNDPRRLAVVLAILVAALMGVGIAALVMALTWPVDQLIEPITDPERRGAEGWRVATGLAALFLVGGSAVQTAPEYAAYASTADRGNIMVGEHDKRAFEWLSTQPRAHDGLIFTNPDEGGGWMYGLQGLPSINRHYLQPPRDASPLYSELFWGMNRAGVDPEIDSALAELDITYVYITPPNYWAFQPPNPALLELDHTPGLMKVYQDQHIRIFAVRQAFSPAQLDEILESSPFPPHERTPLTRAHELYGPEGRVDVPPEPPAAAPETPPEATPGQDPDLAPDPAMPAAPVPGGGL